MRKNERGYGLHLTMDGYGANSQRLNDVGYLYDFLMRFPELIGMERITFPQIVRFTEADKAGISGVVLIVESHISIHTYSLKDFISADVYSCKFFDHLIAINFLKEVYQVQELETNLIVRGKKFPVDNLHD